MMARILIRFSLNIFILLFSFGCNSSDNSISHKDLEINYSGDAEIEIGSAYAGLEFHHSSSLPQRISFYYPVANSIDQSTDFWHRDTSYIMAMGLKIGGAPKELIDPRNFDVTLTPYSAVFTKEDKEKSIRISYRFAKNKPAFVVEYEITNKTNSQLVYEVYTSLEATLRTCHSYKKVTNVKSEYDYSNHTLKINYNDKATKNIQLFSINAGELPINYSNISSANPTPKATNDEWLQNDFLSDSLITKESKNRPAIKFQYKKNVSPNGSIKIVQITGTTFQSEAPSVVDYLHNNYKKEIEEFETSITDKISNGSRINTGDKALDHSVMWARAMLETNKHYLDGDIVPMPCPAEYNFYFTHDVLVTDLAAVNFDLPRVKNDLEFILKHSNNDLIIPHAYYWRDSTYLTEYADHDNWNNFWINIVAAKYLRHSNDTSLVRKLYPYLTKSLQTAMRTLGEDSLMWSYRPDWWDIGKKYGAKTYMTSLAVKTIEEYIYTSLALNLNLNKLNDYQLLVNGMRKNLVKRLWSDEQNYLINYYEPGRIDSHYYIGSLLAGYYGMLDENKTAQLLETAGNILLDENVGIYNAYPMDFHELIDYLGFSGNEAGEKYYYFNGGIWSQGNAWYALALIKNNQKIKAYNFIKNVMTVEGIMNGPNGQPAMYEVRNGNKNNPAEYGTIDKSNFLWAGGWYLNTLYNLLLLKENPWNITLSPFNKNNDNEIKLRLAVSGNMADVSITGTGNHVRSMKINDISYPSLVIPSDFKNIKSIDIQLGDEITTAMISETNSMFLGAELTGNKLNYHLKAFNEHLNVTRIISQKKPVALIADGKEFTNDFTFELIDQYYFIDVNYKHISTETVKITMEFEN